MKNIRSFIAIRLAPDVDRNSARMLQRLRQANDGIKWVPTDNLHLTLKFLGDVDNTEVPAVCKVIQRVCSDHSPFHLDFAGTGGFPSLERPRILYAGINDASGSLTRIVSRLETSLAELGFKQEPRDYIPHLTLGRTRSTSRLANSDVMERLAAEEETHLGGMLVNSLQLVASFLDKSGPTYQIMDTIPLDS
ncbi:MAG: RNA 2',3'-cyclic phosphodiesterase [Rhodopirellula sp.]|nr:RNA 2',3'-cyclic phosphodiesterase [Rhodopirellula sp.]OUX51421.1 MAG: 2'-5' RNA ligase [Rhodopirellula sp. TMED283]